MYAQTHLHCAYLIKLLKYVTIARARSHARFMIETIRPLLEARRRTSNVRSAATVRICLRFARRKPRGVRRDLRYVECVNTFYVVHTVEEIVEFHCERTRHISAQRLHDFMRLSVVCNHCRTAGKRGKQTSAPEWSQQNGWQHFVGDQVLLLMCMYSPLYRPYGFSCLRGLHHLYIYFR